MNGYYHNARIRGEGGISKIAWITAGGPVELLVSMDIIPIYPENHSVMIGASKMGEEMFIAADSLGYSQDLCSYFRADVGSAVTGKSPLVGGIPKPDFLICCNNSCGTVVKWFQVLSRRLNLPLFVIDCPPVHGEITQSLQKYVEHQMMELISFLEGQREKKFDLDRLGEVCGLSNRGRDLWNDVLGTCEHVPAPMTCFDSFTFIGPIVTLRGTKECNEFYETLLVELGERIANGISAVNEERYRLIWDNIPMWGRLKYLSEVFASKGACLVADTYTNAWARRRLDEAKPIESLADVMLTDYLNVDIEQMAREVMELFDRYSAVGFVMHSNRSCKSYSLGQHDRARMVRVEKNIKTLVIEGDMVDERAFNESRIEMRVDAFLETIGEDRKINCANK